MGNVWEWGSEVGGHCWRTAGDLGFDLVGNLSTRCFDIGFEQRAAQVRRPGQLERSRLHPDRLCSAALGPGEIAPVAR